jgi:hypothetical protein
LSYLGLLGIIFTKTRPFLEDGNMSESLERRRQRLETLQQKTKKLEQDIKTADRKLESRKLIILGRYLEQLLARNILDKRVYEENLEKFLTRNVDRELFGYPPLSEEEQPPKKRTKNPNNAKPAPTTTTADTPPQNIPAPLETPKPAQTAATRTNKGTDKRKKQEENKGHKLPEHQKQDELAAAFDL